MLLRNNPDQTPFRYKFVFVTILFVLAIVVIASM
jgi:hypothetical protein